MKRITPILENAVFPLMVFVFMTWTLGCELEKRDIGEKGPITNYVVDKIIDTNDRTTNTKNIKKQNAINGEELDLHSRIVLKIDYWNPVVRSFSLNAIASEHGGYFSINQVCDIWDEIRRRWVYVNDPQGDLYKYHYEFTAASETIEWFDFRGDCDDFAVLVAACIHSIGGQARIRTDEHISTTSAHAYTMLYVGDDPSAVISYITNRYSIDNNGNQIHFWKEGNEWWLNLDWTAYHPGGPFYYPDDQRRILLDIKP